MKVRDVMSMHVVEVVAEATCQEAARLMRDKNVGLLIVTRGGRVIEGVLTDRDLVTRCMALGGDPAEQRVGEHMDRHPTTVEANLEVESAVEIMRNARLRRLPVTVAGAKVIGLISLDDIALDVKHYADAFLTTAGQYSRQSRLHSGVIGE